MRVTGYLNLLLLSGLVACGDRPGPGPGTPPELYQAVSPSRFDSGPAELGAGAEVVTLLHGERLASDPVFGAPFWLLVTGHRLWVADSKGDPFLHVIKLATGEVERSLGRRGEGPGDFHSVMDLGASPGDSSGLWAFDVALGRLTYMTLDAPGIPVRVVTPKAPRALPLKLRWLTEKTLVGLWIQDSARLVIYDSTGRVLRTRRFEVLGDSLIPFGKRRGLSTGSRFCMNPEGKGFGIMFTAAGRIDRYDSDGIEIPPFLVPFQSNGDFEQDSLGKWQAHHPREYYRDCATTPKHLYALFSGRLLTKFPEGPGWEGVYVHVFDWDGRLRAVYRLDHGAQALAVVGDSVIYASANQTDTIYKYRLPGR